MKTRLIAIALFGATAASLALYPAYKVAAVNEIALTATNPDGPQVPDRSRVEVVFVLDTTGSMGGMLEAAKEKIWSIATSLSSAQSSPEIRMGLVAYRDRGDSYVTRVLDLSGDLDSIYAALMDFQAAGGGDGPESVNQALHDAVHNISWSQGPATYRALFLVGDAPPHMDYPNDVKFPQTLAAAADRDIVVNTIQCGQDSATTRRWGQIAKLGGGRYFQVGQAGGALAIATPFDERIAQLSAQLDETRLYYGTAEQKKRQQRKLAASDKLHMSASDSSRARRAAFNLSPSGQANFLGENELVDDVASGRVDLATIDPRHLPEPMQAMPEEAQQRLIADSSERRKELQQRIEQVSGQRARFLDEQVEKLGGAEQSLDHEIYRTVKEQAGKKGLRYEAGSVAY